MTEIKPDDVHEIDTVPTEAEVVEIVGKTAIRIAANLLEGIEAPPALLAALEERIRSTLLEDAEIATALILSGSYDEGREDTALEFAKAGAEPAAKSPDWSDVTSPGEARAIKREEDLCGRCSRSPVCVVARLAPPEALIVVRRCALFEG